MSRIRWVMLVVGILLSAMGTVWALQGVDVIGGSSMSGEGQWLIIGIVAGLVGLALVYRSLTARS